MLDFFLPLFSWMPHPLPGICGGAVIIFFIITIIHLLKFIIDIILFWK